MLPILTVVLLIQLHMQLKLLSVEQLRLIDINHTKC
jgi:hypothetical protein